MPRLPGEERREIKLLKEFRARLIAEVVTGKPGVHEAAAQPSDEPNFRMTDG